MEATVRVPRTWPYVSVAAGSLVVVVAGVAAFHGSAPYVGLADLVRIAAPGLVLGVAAAVAAVSGGRRSGPVLLVVATLGSAASALSIGLDQRWSGWVAVGALTWLLAPAVVGSALTFPDGGLPSRTGRVVTWAVLALGTATVIATVASYDPGAWSWCRCVRNPLAGAVGPDGYGRVANAVTIAHATVVGLGLVAFVATRMRPAPRGRGLAFALCLVILMLAWLTADLIDLNEATRPTWLTDLAELALVLTPVLYIAAYAGRRPSRAHVADLLLAARDEHNLVGLEALVGRALGDPKTVVAWWDVASEEYRDHAGRPVRIPAYATLTVDAGGRPIAQVVSERIAWVGASVRDSVAEALRLAAENRRLTTELQQTLDQVKDSRARILTASDDARRRIERDLHDGAQQLLVSTGIKLKLAVAEANTGSGAAHIAGVLDEASEQLNQALAELRQITAGIAPTALVHGSLADALQELALRSAVPTTIRITGSGEPDEATASATYYVVSECLVNIAKHAAASKASVVAELADPLIVGVTDDGRGGAVLDGRGTGLRGLVDRIDARGGTLVVRSDHTGTTVTMSLPLHSGLRSGT